MLPLKGRVMHNASCGGEEGYVCWLLLVEGGKEKGKEHGVARAEIKGKGARGGYMGKHSDRFNGAKRCWSWIWEADHWGTKMDVPSSMRTKLR